MTFPLRDTHCRSFRPKKNRTFAHEYHHGNIRLMWWRVGFPPPPSSGGLARHLTTPCDPRLKRRHSFFKCQGSPVPCRSIKPSSIIWALGSLIPILIHCLVRAIKQSILKRGFPSSTFVLSHLIAFIAEEEIPPVSPLRFRKLFAKTSDSSMLREHCSIGLLDRTPSAMNSVAVPTNQYPCAICSVPRAFYSPLQIYIARTDFPFFFSRKVSIGLRHPLVSPLFAFPPGHLSTLLSKTL